MEKENYYFDTIKEAKDFLNKNGISKGYHFETPMYLETGVELVVEKESFICEICGEKTPVECEGSEPNTCAMCMPIGEKESNYGNN